MLVDGVVAASSRVLDPRETELLRVPVRGARTVTLRVLNGGDGYECDHAVWGLARFIAEGHPELAQGRDRFLAFGLGITGFDQATFLRGMEQLLVDLYTDRQAAERVLDMVFDFENAMIERARNLDLDCVKFDDPWSTRRGEARSPEAESQEPAAPLAPLTVGLPPIHVQLCHPPYPGRPQVDGHP